MRPDVPIGLEISTNIGCPVRCDYCPQDILLSRYTGPRVFTYDSFRKTLDVGQIPITRNLTFMGASEPFCAKDCMKMMQWALRERGHMGSVSTTLYNITHADIDAIAELKDRLTDTVLHAPAADNRMPGLVIDDKYVELFKHALTAWRNNPDFVVQVYDREPHEAIHRIWQESGVHIPRFGLHDRAGLLPNLQGPYVKHGRHQGSVPLCGKQFCGHLMPNSHVYRCCNDFGLHNDWGSLLEHTYYELYHSQKFRDYIKSLQDQNSDVPCRKCFDGYHQVNKEDQSKGYDLIGH